jgi:DNA-binding NarL/FixJ family response regulator
MAAVAAEGAGQIRVLLVDDDEPFLASLSELVDSQPELLVAGAVSDGLAALELVEEREPDAVVIDLHMPLLDGVSTVARLRRDRPSLCLIAITGDDAPALRRAVTDAGADAVLLKAELVEGLITRLRETVAAAHAQ